MKLNKMTISITLALFLSVICGILLQDHTDWANNISFLGTIYVNLIKMIILYFDCDDNYGEFDVESGCGGYGDGFTLEQCFQYIEDNGGYEEFDFYS